VEFTNKTTIDPVRKILSENYPSFGSHEFPDVMRADVFIKELNSYEAMEGDKLPALMIMALPNDHTGGTKPGLPTPRQWLLIMTCTWPDHRSHEQKQFGKYRGFCC